MEYTCILKNGSRKETWTGKLTLLRKSPGQYEAGISGGGLTSTSSPDGINMGITCAFQTMMSGAGYLISLISSGTKRGSAA